MATSTHDPARECMTGAGLIWDATTVGIDTAEVMRSCMQVALRMQVSESDYCPLNQSSNGDLSMLHRLRLVPPSEHNDWY